VQCDEPVTIAVRPVPSIPSVTSSAVEEDEKPEPSFLPNSHHILNLLHSQNKTHPNK